MDYLWTPWRYQYVTTTGDNGECIFCAAAQASDLQVAIKANSIPPVSGLLKCVQPPSALG